jgi:predicted ATP-dependent serine protease
LVVECDPHIRDLEEYFLNEAGYEVEFALDGVAALTRARAILPQIIAETAVVKRVRTGSIQADHVLGGGFPDHSINIVMGQPGTGKTIFAEQMLFENAQGDRPSLFITTLSEPLAKAVRYVQQFEFYDEQKLGTDIQYHDVGSVLTAAGPEPLTMC